MQPVNYGTTDLNMIATMERMRANIDTTRRLVMIKLLARTVIADGSHAESVVAQSVQDDVTAYLRTVFPED
jgi:uncharacterized tellurite resistance protein B-like protein